MQDYVIAAPESLELNLIEGGSGHDAQKISLARVI
jgi:hypothetical protein